MILIPILKRVSEWFKTVYEKPYNPHFESHTFAFNLRGTIWRMRVGVVFGSIQLFLDKRWDRTGGFPINASRNLIHDDFTAAYAERLSRL